MSDPTSSGVPGPEDVKSSRILLVDDSPANLAILRRLLARAGFHRVATLEDPRGLDAELAASPDMVLLDLHLPDAQSGLAALERIRDQVPPDAFLPVIMVTADLSAGASEEALARGAHDFLTKPLHPSELTLRVTNLLRLRRLHEEVLRQRTALAAELEARRLAELRTDARRAALRANVARVLADESLRTVFQPVVDVTTGTIVGAEALSRFECEPRQGPDLWFRDAGEVGLSVPLELHAVRRALAKLPEIPEPVFVSVNVSANTLLDPHAAEVFAGQPCHRIVVEITEQEAVTDYDALRGSLDRLKALGLRIAVDDAGAGFSSLQHVLRLAPSHIKLDRFLITGIHADPVRRSLVTALASFALETGSMLVAEGVETAEELRTLRALGIRHVQGWLLARPAPLPLPTVRLFD